MISNVLKGFVFLMIGFIALTAFDAKETKTMSIDKFDNFLGLKYGGIEPDVKKVLGVATGGEYTDSKSAFMYYYKDTKRVPVTVYVNSKTGDIETVFMEILGLDENFDEDVKRAKKDFKIKKDHLALFGKQPEEIITIFGLPKKDAIEEDSVEKDVRHMVYYSKDEKITLGLKFYPSQGNKMTSIVVDWFY